MIEQIVNLPFWEYEFWGNSLGGYSQAVGIFIGFLIVLKIFQSMILIRFQKLAERTKTNIDDALIKIIKSIKPPFYFVVAFYFAFKILVVSSIIWQVINFFLIAIVVYQVTIAFNILVDYVLNGLRERETEKSTQAALRLVGKIVKGIIWVIAVLLALSNFGVNVTSLVAGVGIGGVAVALAAQNILGDLFSSFVIYFDKPFVVGDFIVVGDKMGTVEGIGVKTTRVKALNGEELIFSNNELTSAQIRNYKKMKERRASFKFGVTYNTPPEKLKKIPGIVKKAVESTEDVKFDRGFFDNFEDSAITFEVVYYVQKPDYNVYTEQNQKIAFKLKEELDKERIEMAFPTQTVYLKKEDTRE